MGKIVAVGDIHGEYDKLTVLMHNLDQAGVDFNNEPLVFLGDYVDGGPDTNLVVASLLNFQRLFPHWVFLKGNHEDMLANAYFDKGKYDNSFLVWYTQGGMETFQSYLGEDRPEGSDLDIIRAVIPQYHVLWLDRLPLFHETNRFFFVHAGVRPGQEPEQVSERDALWIRKEFYQSGASWRKRIVFGHTPFPEPLVSKNLIGLDTMHHGHGDITAAILDDETGDIIRFVTS